MKAANDAQTIWVKTACEKEHKQKSLSKLILQYRNVAYATKPLQTFEETKNAVDKLATDKLQLLLINVLITSIFEHWFFTR